MINDGLYLMVLGMLTVFTFLVVIVISMSIMSWIITKHFPEKEIPKAVASGGSSAESEVAVAIAAAAAQANS